MNCGGRADPRGESAAQVEQGDRHVQGKDGEGGRVADPVNPTGRLKDFRRAGVYIGSAVEYGAVLLGGLIA